MGTATIWTRVSRVRPMRPRLGDFDGRGRVESTSARDALVSIGRCPQAGSAWGIAQASFEVFCKELRLNLQGLLRFRQ
jgi:hypothetical protein